MSTPELSERIDLNVQSIAIKTVDGTIVRSAAAGPCSISVIDPRTRVSRTITLRLAYYVPGAAFNLFAVQAAQDHGLAIHFDDLVDGYYGTVRQGDTFDDVLCLIQNVGGALCLTCPTFHPPSVSCNVACTAHTSPSFSPAPPLVDLAHLIQQRNGSSAKSVKWTMDDAYRNRGHRSSADILQMSTRGLLPRIQLITRSMAPCTACLVGNLNFHSVVPQIHHRATCPLERVYLYFLYLPTRLRPRRLA